MMKLAFPLKDQKHLHFTKTQISTNTESQMYLPPHLLPPSALFHHSIESSAGPTVKRSLPADWTQSRGAIWTEALGALGALGAPGGEQAGGFRNRRGAEGSSDRYLVDVWLFSSVWLCNSMLVTLCGCLYTILPERVSMLTLANAQWTEPGWGRCDVISTGHVNMLTWVVDLSRGRHTADEIFQFGPTGSDWVKSVSAERNTLRSFLVIVVCFHFGVFLHWCISN